MINSWYGVLLLVSAMPGATETLSIDAKILETSQETLVRFIYDCQVNQIPDAAEKLKIWIPIPRRDTVQDHELVEISSPGPLIITREEEYGNRMAYCELPLPADRDSLRWRLVHRVTRHPWTRAAKDDGPNADLKRYLAPDRLTPTSGYITEVASDIRNDTNTKATSVGRQLYDFCISEMSYSKDGVGWGQGDVKWACDAKTGNCSDYHSLFIALCRVRGIPAKFEIGFPLPYSGDRGTVGGYHCWAKFYDPESGWIALDASEADKHPALKETFFGGLDSRRIHFTTGRDITLSPPQEGPPLNFFVYPYVEIDGKSHPHVSKQFEFRILKGDG
jgi:transglutaminase-like putative cysteine protease